MQKTQIPQSIWSHSLRCASKDHNCTVVPKQPFFLDGSQGTFSISVNNLGSGAVPPGTTITVNESLPPGLVLPGDDQNTVGYFTSGGWSCIETGSDTNIFVCSYTVGSGGLPPNGSLPPITFPVDVTGQGPFKNCASVEGELTNGTTLQEPMTNNNTCIDIPVGPPTCGLTQPDLYVSNENPMFSNKIFGPMVTEVVVCDSDISNTSDPVGEPDVTINGKILRMVQATDGKWYGYFAHMDAAQNADSIAASGPAGQSLDFGKICPNTSR